MKNSKWLLRIALLLLVCTMLLGAVACQKTPTDAPETTPETDPVTPGTGSGETDPTDTDPTDTEPSDGENLPELNMGSKEFTVLLRAGDEYLNDIGIMKQITDKVYLKCEIDFVFLRKERKKRGNRRYPSSIGWQSSSYSVRRQ